LCLLFKQIGVFYLAVAKLVSYGSYVAVTVWLEERILAPGPSVATATAKNLTLPIADTDQTKNPLLKPDGNGNIATVAYQFGNREVEDTDLFK
jgi:hypothetical protein